MQPVHHRPAAPGPTSAARRGAAGLALASAIAVTGVISAAPAAAAAPDHAGAHDRAAGANRAASPGLDVTQGGLGLGEILFVDPTASGAKTDVQLSTNGVALGDLAIGDPNATPQDARSLDLALANLRIND